MSQIFLVTGMIVWGAFALFVLWILFEIAVGFFTAVSNVRWHLAGSSKKFIWRQHMRKMPRFFLSRWYQFIDYRNNGSRTETNCETGASWRGIGDWDSHDPNVEGTVDGLEASHD